MPPSHLSHGQGASRCASDRQLALIMCYETECTLAGFATLVSKLPRVKQFLLQVHLNVLLALIMLDL